MFRLRRISRPDDSHQNRVQKKNGDQGTDKQHHAGKTVQESLTRGIAVVIGHQDENNYTHDVGEKGRNDELFRIVDLGIATAILRGETRSIDCADGVVPRA